MFVEGLSRPHRLHPRCLLFTWQFFGTNPVQEWDLHGGGGGLSVNLRDLPKLHCSAGPGPRKQAQVSQAVHKEAAVQDTVCFWRILWNLFGMMEKDIQWRSTAVGGDNPAKN